MLKKEHEMLRFSVFGLLFLFKKKIKTLFKHYHS